MGRVWRLDWGESHRFTESGQEPECGPKLTLIAGPARLDCRPLHIVCSFLEPSCLRPALRGRGTDLSAALQCDAYAICRVRGSALRLLCQPGSQRLTPNGCAHHSGRVVLSCWRCAVHTSAGIFPPALRYRPASAGRSTTDDTRHRRRRGDAGPSSVWDRSRHTRTQSIKSPQRTTGVSPWVNARN